MLSVRHLRNLKGQNYKEKDGHSMIYQKKDEPWTRRLTISVSVLLEGGLE
jgi:hypothetical protein